MARVESAESETLVTHILQQSGPEDAKNYRHDEWLIRQCPIAPRQFYRSHIDQIMLYNIRID